MGEGFNAHSLPQDLEKEPIRTQLVRGSSIKQLQPRTTVLSGTEKGLGSGNGIPGKGRFYTDFTIDQPFRYLFIFNCTESNLPLSLFLKAKTSGKPKAYSVVLNSYTNAH